MSYKWESFMMCWNSYKRPWIHFPEWFWLHYLHVVRFAFWFCRKKKQLISINSFYMQHWTLYKIWHGPLMLRTLILKFPFVLQNSLVFVDILPLFLYMHCFHTDNVLFSLTSPRPLITIANMMVVIHVLGSYQVCGETSFLW